MTGNPPVDTLWDMCWESLEPYGDRVVETSFTLFCRLLRKCDIVGSTEAPSKVLLLFSLFSDWLKLNHLKSRIERGSLDIFSRHTCSVVYKRSNTSDKLRNKFWREKMF